MTRILLIAVFMTRLMIDVEYLKIILTGIFCILAFVAPVRKLARKLELELG
jgi:hypothetical protein